jgi:hypothetical protein
MKMNSWLTLNRLEQWLKTLWGITLFTLPVTSFRWLPEVMGKTEVRPMSIYSLAILVPLMGVYYWKKRAEFRWPVQTTALLAFILAALISTAIGGYYAPLDLRGQTYWGWALRAWLSFGVGMGFFWVAVLISKSEEFFRSSLKWMYASLVFTIVWGLVQALAIHTPLIDFETINQIQLSFSVRGLVNSRISGFAFEPSWLADQIVIFYFPWLFAALLTGFRLTKNPWLEPVLLLGSLGILLLTYSRSGIFGLGIAVTIVMLTVGRGILVGIWSWFWAPLVSPEVRGKWSRLLVIILVVAIVAAVFWWLNDFQYFASIWQFDRDWTLKEYITSIYAAPRVAYIVSGIEIFNMHPWFGVGLGGSSFYLFDTLPNWALVDPYEIARQVSPDANSIPNVRNLLIRLLSETGIVGFWLYIGFIFSILGSIRRMFLSRKQVMVYASVAGLTIWITVLIRQFTLSTLTSPIIWVSLGAVVGYAHHILDVPKQSVETSQLENNKED